MFTKSNKKILTCEKSFEICCEGDKQWSISVGKYSSIGFVKAQFIGIKVGSRLGISQARRGWQVSSIDGLKLGFSEYVGTESIMGLKNIDRAYYHMYHEDMQCI